MCESPPSLFLISTDLEYCDTMSKWVKFDERNILFISMGKNAKFALQIDIIEILIDRDGQSEYIRKLFF